MVFSESAGCEAASAEFRRIACLFDGRQQRGKIVFRHHPSATGFLNPSGGFAISSADIEDGASDGKAPLELAGNHQPLPCGIQAGQMNVSGAEVSAQLRMGRVIKKLDAHSRVCQGK